MSITPLILSGGSGTRLWPLSRASKPKQFLSFGRDRSLFQDTVLRCGSDFFDRRPIVVGADAHRFLLAEDLLEIGVKADILLEPAARNSCAAIAAGCLEALKRSPDSLVLVLAADHHIPDPDAFGEAVVAASSAAKAGFLVTFGVHPDRPATGYGYIQTGDIADGPCVRVRAFVEKPAEAVAREYVEAGFLWNSGNFLFRAATFLDELGKLQPEILEAVRESHVEAGRDLDFLRLGPAFARAPSISVDYAVMEKTDKAAVLPVNYSWSDVGSWDSVSQVIERDAHDNAVIGDAAIIDSRDSLVHSHGRLTALIGLESVVVISTRDSLLVASKERAGDVKDLVARLREDGRAEAAEALQIFRPWGNYERLDMDTGYQVKRIVVKSGGILSLQKHKHRAEHWVVVKGEAEVTIGTDVRVVKANESVYLPLGVVHRLANRGKEPVVLIEVQTGDYLGEDDIIRLEDVYNREPVPAKPG